MDSNQNENQESKVQVEKFILQINPKDTYKLNIKSNKKKISFKV
ncbi:hypothetical protein [Bacillus xiapuensis]|uniref:Uncharacterized protein n=1 Tax=Bacillus xiapuensis TaxID=2014075 RepID=A0ABU6N7R3_9BACI|nr:hypothetical protein [Bacillus xiapuensis]